MNYELTLIPMGYESHIRDSHACCIHCEEKMDLIDHFFDTKELTIEHEGLLYACSNCGANHLELLNSVMEFESPVVIEWD